MDSERNQLEVDLMLVKQRHLVDLVVSRMLDLEINNQQQQAYLGQEGSELSKQPLEALVRNKQLEALEPLGLGRQLAASALNHNSSKGLVDLEVDLVLQV